MTQKSLIEFPCEFPVKIIGIHSALLIEDIQKITKKHFLNFSEDKLSLKPSQKNNYLAITVTVLAQNQEMLDDFYREITQHAMVKMVL